MRCSEVLCIVLILSGCTAFDKQLPSCTSNMECTARASMGSSTEVPAVCVGQDVDRHCEQLLSDDCYKITAGTGASGDTNDAYKNDAAILIGSLFETGGPAGSGSTGQTNQRREESAILAVQEINTARGVPGASLASPRAGGSYEPRRAAVKRGTTRVSSRIRLR